MVLPWFSRYTRHPNSSNAVAQADDFSQDSRCRASGSFGGKDTLQSKMAGNPPNYMVHDPQTAVVNSAFWHLKKVSGVVAPYWYFRCENQGFGISQNYFFLHNICWTLALFSSMVSADLFGGFAQPCKEDTWLTRSQELLPHELLN